MRVRKLFPVAWRLAIASVVLCGAVQSSAQSTGLNAPIPPPTLTVGSEIKRGADAADRCSTVFVLPTKSDGFIDCIDVRQSTNRQTMGNGYEAYDAGLYFMAKMNIGVALEILSKRGRDVGVLQAKLNVYDVRYRQARDKLGLGDSEVQRGALIGN